MRDCARNSNSRAENATLFLESSTISFSKKRKIHNDFAFDEYNSPSHQDHRFLPALSLNKINSHVTSSNSGGFISGEFVARRSFSGESNLLSKDSLRNVDLEAKSFEIESSTCIDNRFSRETTPSSEFYGDTDEMDSLATGDNNSCGKKLQAKKTPNQEEIDRFFAEAEKKSHERFAEKYNFDVVKDAPLEGRYQWVLLKP